MIEELTLRLLATGTPFAIVEGVNALADVTDRPTATPAAFIYVATEATGPNERITGPVLQRAEADIAVVIVTSNLTDVGAAAGDLVALKRWVRAKLLGFLPAEAEDPITHVTGELVQAKDGMVWWEDVFATAYYLRETQ